MKTRLTVLQVAVHAGGLAPLVVLGYRYFAGNLGIDPVLELEHQTGRVALFFLVLSLACTPISQFMKWKEPVRRRKALGLYGALYAFIHFGIFLSLDYGFDLGLVLEQITRRPYIIVGAIALLILVLLAFTSIGYIHRKLGTNWKKIHRLVYILSPLVIIHYAMVVKGNLFTLQGNYSTPLIYAGVVLVLLILRIPSIKSRLIQK